MCIHIDPRISLYDRSINSKLSQRHISFYVKLQKKSLHIDKLKLISLIT